MYNTQYQEELDHEHDMPLFYGDVDMYAGSEPDEIADMIQAKNVEGCLFPGFCCMAGEHLVSECHTVKMMEDYEANSINMDDIPF